MSKLKDSTLVLEPDDSHGQTYKVKVDEPTILSKRKLLLIGMFRSMTTDLLHCAVDVSIGVLAIIILIIIITVAAVSASKSHEQVTEKKERYPVIVISLDGFKYSYLDRGTAPNIQKLAKNGVRAKFLQPQFPTKTFPNHYSIATGLYPVHSGIVANRFYDPTLKDIFKIGGRTSLDPKWWKGEPLWQTAMKNGLVSASYFFVGSEVPIEGMLPNITNYYNQSHPFETRVKKVLEWLSYAVQGSRVDASKDDDGRDKWRPDFITLYFHEPDSTGHRYGPDSPEVDNQTRYVDQMIGMLFDGLEKLSLEDKVNVIVLADHGMAATNCSAKKVTYLDEYGVTVDDIFSSQKWGGAFMSLSPKQGGALNKTEILSRIQCKFRYMRVFAKEELPKRLHYSYGSRIGDIIVIPEDGWLIGTNSSLPCYGEKGTHGYDPMAESMGGLFVAYGPSFKRGVVVDHFQNTEIYNMITSLLDIPPAPNDGMPGSLQHLLRSTVDAPKPILEGDGKLFDTETCKYPGDKVAAERRNCKYCVCSYCDLKSKSSKLKVEDLDELLDLTSEQVSQYQSHNLPWGLPQGGAGEGGCILNQKEYINGYSTYLRVPLWVGYRLDGEKADQRIPRRNCFRHDVRLTHNQASTCTHYWRSGMDRGHLVPNADFDYTATAALNTFVLSNIAPQYHGFNVGDWAKLEDYVRDLAVNFTTVYVISGSIFDENADGLRDEDKSVTRWIKNQTNTVAIPTHFYKIIVRCDETKTPYYEVPGCNGRLDVMSFILPHNNKQRCWLQSFKEYLLDNSATVRDIEKLTGSTFFSGLPPLEQARLKTYTPIKLWL